MQSSSAVAGKLNSVLSRFPFVVGSRQFHPDALGCLLHVYLAWDSQSFRNMWFQSCRLLWKFFSHSFKYYFRLVFSFPSETSNVCMFDFSLLPYISGSFMLSSPVLLSRYFSYSSSLIFSSAVSNLYETLGS